VCEGGKLATQIEPFFLAPVPKYKVNKHKNRRDIRHQIADSRQFKLLSFNCVGGESGRAAQITEGDKGEQKIKNKNEERRRGEHMVGRAGEDRSKWSRREQR
jgi:hypothetical protein